MKNIEHYIPKVYYENLNKTYLKNIDTFIEENKDKKLAPTVKFIELVKIMMEYDKKNV